MDNYIITSSNGGGFKIWRGENGNYSTSIATLAFNPRSTTAEKHMIAAALAGAISALEPPARRESKRNGNGKHKPAQVAT